MHLQVLLVDFHDAGRDVAFLSSSQHSSSFLEGCFFPQCLQTGALRNFFCFSSLFFFFSSLVELVGLVGVIVLSLTRLIISFIASVLALISDSIWRVCASVRLAMSSYVASACCSIAFAFICFAVCLFCLFSFAYSADMKILMFAHVLVATGLASHSLTAESYSPVLFR